MRAALGRARPAPVLSNADRKIDRNARRLLDDIRLHLGSAPFFTREDLLHLPTFDHVATISRYQAICQATRRLLDRLDVVAKSRTDLCLGDQQAAYDSEKNMATRYSRTIRRLAVGRPADEPFGVMDIVNAWSRTDQHLTTNAKRVAVRGLLRQLARDGLIEADGDYSYIRKGTEDAK